VGEFGTSDLGGVESHGELCSRNGDIDAVLDFRVVAIGTFGRRVHLHRKDGWKRKTDRDGFLGLPKVSDRARWRRILAQFFAQGASSGVARR
jgi:hypothetical protein